jgi:hypothetical protein
MKDVQQLLAEKENELARIQKEIQSLQMILPLLADDSSADSSSSAASSHQTLDRKPPETTSQSRPRSQATGTEGKSEGESRLWDFARRWRNK